MDYEPVHIHINRQNLTLRVFLLLLPALVFILVLSLIVSSKQEDVASVNVEPAVLGGESELDNPPGFGSE